MNAGVFINGGLATMASKSGFLAGFSSRIMSHSLSRVSPWKMSNSVQQHVHAGAESILAAGGLGARRTASKIFAATTLTPSFVGAPSLSASIGEY